MDLYWNKFTGVTNVLLFFQKSTHSFEANWRPKYVVLKAPTPIFLESRNWKSGIQQLSHVLVHCILRAIKLYIFCLFLLCKTSSGEDAITHSTMTVDISIRKTAPAFIRKSTAWSTCIFAQNEGASLLLF